MLFLSWDNNIFKINFIKNLPTSEDLQFLFQSELYNNLLIRFDSVSAYKLDKRNHNYPAVIKNYIQKKYLILNIPFEEVLKEFELNQEKLLQYFLLKITYFNDWKKKYTKDDIKTLGIIKTFLLDIFCEFYLLKGGDKERLFHFLKTIQMPYAKKYQKEITELYSNIRNL